jgi:hypothetical protein
MKSIGKWCLWWALLNNYMETTAASGKIPWDDLRYIFGEIMYGGHIVDNVDRRFCSTFLENLMTEKILEEEELFPFIEGRNISFKCPPPYPYEKYIEHIETECPPETPLAFGMHPNAEIDFRTTQCQELFMTLQEIQPRGGGAGSGGGVTVQEKIQEFMHRVSDETQLDSNKLNIDDIASKLAEDQRGPYQNAFLQECEYMNALIGAIVGSLAEIELAFKGELTMTEKMEASSISARDPTMAPIKAFMYSHSWRKAFWYGPLWSSASLLAMSSMLSLLLSSWVSSDTLCMNSWIFSWTVTPPPDPAPPPLGWISWRVMKSSWHCVVLKSISAFGCIPKANGVSGGHSVSMCSMYFSYGYGGGHLNEMFLPSMNGKSSSSSRIFSVMRFSKKVEQNLLSTLSTM